MDKKQIERINELARKKKAEGLTEEELAEQAALRQQYLKEFREYNQVLFDSIRIQNADGTITPLKKKTPPIKH